MNRPFPWRDLSAPLSALQGELNRLFALSRDFGAIGPTGSPDAPPSAWSPAVDLIESDDAILVLADLPGVDPSGVELTVVGQFLELRGHRESGDPEAATGPIGERPTGPFYRRVPLPAEVDVDSIKAEARHGVLHVRLPKAPTARPRTIPIRVG